MNVAAALVLAACSHAASVARRASDAPPVPYEDPGACPFEGCTYREWTTNAAVDIRADRRAGAPVAFRLGAGEKIAAVTGVVVTIKPGRAQFREAVTLDTSDGRVDVTPEDTLYLLTYLGEGNFKVWLRGRFYAYVDGADFMNGACDRFPDRCRGSIVEKAQSEWWVQIRNKAGRVGWTDQADKFDGKDALGGR
jgi:hypothetical protein